MTDERAPLDEVHGVGGANGASPQETARATARARRLIPERLDFLIGERPLLWYESPEEFDALREEVFAEIVPSGAIEAIMVKNLVDVLWEARRLRRLKLHAIHDEMPSVAAKMCVGYGDYKHAERERLEHLAQAAAHGIEIELKEGEASFEERIDDCGGTAEMVHSRVLSQYSDELDRLDRRVQRVEDRFYQLLRQFESRRAGMAAMARTLMERERSQVIDLEVEG